MSSLWSRRSRVGGERGSCVGGYGRGGGGARAPSFILLCVCAFACPPPNPQPVIQSLQQELCPSFLLPSAPGEKLYSFLGQHLVLYSACSNGEARPRERSHRACRAKLELALGLHFALCPLTLPSCAPAECQAPRRDPRQMKLLWVRATF